MHTCPAQDDINQNELENIAAEIESRNDQVKDIPEAIKKIVVGNPAVFKTELDPIDHIDLAKIPGYSGYEEGIKIEIQPNAKPIANHSMRQPPLHYADQIKGMYQDLIN